MHDTGKLAVPGRILNKAGRPSDDEWADLRRHPAEGAKLCAPLLPWLGDTGTGIAQHHERFDGRGYPAGLAGNEISLAGRILAVADSFEVMTAARPYKRAMSAEAAREELARCAGSQFDPAIVLAFLSISLGRLRLAIGPLSWLAQWPFLSHLPQFGTNASQAGAALGGAAALGAAGLLVPTPATSLAEVSPTVVNQPLEEAPATDRSAAGSESPGEASALRTGERPEDLTPGWGEPADAVEAVGDTDERDTHEPVGDTGEQEAVAPASAPTPSTEPVAQHTEEPATGDPGEDGAPPATESPVHDVVDRTTDAPDDMESTVGDVVGPVVDALPDSLGDTIGVTADVVGEVLDDVVSGVGDTTSGVVDTVDGAGDTVDGVVGGTLQRLRRGL